MSVDQHPASPGWLSYADAHPGLASTVVGDLRVLRGVGSHGLVARDINVYLPPSYATDPEPTYPVLYLHDGQNVFDAATSFAGEWGVDEAAEAAAASGLGELVVVGIPNGQIDRAREYSPWPEPGFGGVGGDADAYLSFVAETVRPAVEGAFRVRRDREGVGIAGSSLGGLISLYAALSRPDEYGFCGAFSPALFFGEGQMFAYAETAAGPEHRVYLDVGGREALPNADLDPNGATPYVNAVRRMRDLLTAKGVDVRYVEDPDAEHNEPAWRARFPAALAWFLALTAAA